MALRTAYLALHRRTSAALEPSGVTADQFVVMTALADGDALSQRGLARRTASDSSTLRAMLVLLEARGFVERRRHPQDARARRVRLTPEGRRAFKSLWSRGKSLRAQLEETLPADELEMLVDALRRVAVAMSPRSAVEAEPVEKM